MSTEQSQRLKNIYLRIVSTSRVIISERKVYTEVLGIIIITCDTFKVFTSAEKVRYNKTMETAKSIPIIPMRQKVGENNFQY